jgi:hypothetical protein
VAGWPGKFSCRHNISQNKLISCPFFPAPQTLCSQYLPLSSHQCLASHCLFRRNNSVYSSPPSPQTNQQQCGALIFWPSWLSAWLSAKLWSLPLVSRRQTLLPTASFLRNSGGNTTVPLRRPTTFPVPKICPPKSSGGTTTVLPRRPRRLLSQNVFLQTSCGGPTAVLQGRLIMP